MLAAGFGVEVAVGVGGGGAALAGYVAEGGERGAIERALHHEVVVVDFRRRGPGAKGGRAAGLRVEGGELDGQRRGGYHAKQRKRRDVRAGHCLRDRGSDGTPFGGGGVLVPGAAGVVLEAGAGGLEARHGVGGVPLQREGQVGAAGYFLAHQPGFRDVRGTQNSHPMPSLVSVLSRV